jgi:hypothetical protein
MAPDDCTKMMRQLQSEMARHHRRANARSTMNEGDYWITLLIDAAAAGDDRHLLGYLFDAFCEASLTDTLPNWVYL